MTGIENNQVNIRKISPADGQYFFGYYDMMAYDASDRYHLCHRIDFMDRLPTKEDVAQIGYIDTENNAVKLFAETTAWCFQQGAMLRYHPVNRDEVLYNIREENTYKTVIHNIKTNAKRICDMAAATISPDGKYGLSVNFDRIYDFRPGYGYCGGKDPYFDIPQPTNDGIFLTDLETGRSKLLIDYKRMLREFPIKGKEHAKFIVNHITFNPTSNRFLFLLRNFPSEARGGWRTSLITADLDGNMHLLLHDTMISHYTWKNERQILVFGVIDDVKRFYLVDDLTNRYASVQSPCFDKDLHTSYSPDGTYIIGDGYPVDGHRPIYLYNTKTGKEQILLRAYTVPVSIGDIRCDLHARWNGKGDRISFDSTHTGNREIWEIDFSKPKI